MNMTDCRYKVDRPAHTEQEFQAKLRISSNDESSLIEKVKTQTQRKCSCSKNCLGMFFRSLFPIFGWLRRYQKQWIPGDIISGLTVGVVHIPQSLAFSILAGLAPVFGLYTSFYPVFIYTLMGTSRHISVGTFAVTSLLTRSVIFRHYPPEMTSGIAANETTNITITTMSPETNSTEAFSDLDLRRAGLAAALTLVMGIFQLIFGSFRLGFITSYLSEPVIQGFTTGAAFQVITSQTPVVLGLSVRSFSGPLSFIFSWIEIFQNLPLVHVATLVVSIVCIIILAIGREINLRYKQKLMMPIPTEVIVVIISILASHFGRFQERFEVNVVDNVPTGLPSPRLPDVNILGSIIGDGFALAVVGFAISVSLAKMYGMRHGYAIDANQELVAYGAANIIPSFFLCFPSAAALSRCEIQYNTGGQTQVVGIISIIIVLIVILVLGPVFEPLPRAVLASIIIVGLFGILSQLKNLKTLFKTSKIDFVIWIVTWLAVILLGVDVGLLLGVVFSIITIIARTQVPRFEVLANIADTDVYRAEGKYQKQVDSDGVIIVKMHSSLYYANKEFFKSKLLKAVKFDPGDILTKRKQVLEKMAEKQRKFQTRTSGCCAVRKRTDNQMKQEETHADGSAVEVEVPSVDEWEPNVHSVIVDCASFGFVDFGGGKVLKQLCQQFKELGISFLLANCNADVQSQLMRSGFMDVAGDESTFISVHDAALFALYNRKTTSRL